MIFSAATTLFLLMFSPAISASDGSGMKVSAAVDLVGEFKVKADDEHSDDDGDEEHSGASDKFEPRVVDIMFYGPVDPYFDGLVSLAAHGEAFEVHEAYISSDRLIPRTRFRLGQFFLNVGRLGTIHQHEWPFISTPLVQEAFFEGEGVLDSGIEVSMLLPLPFYLDVTLGATNGYVWGHSHTEGEKPRYPTHYAHILSFFSLGSFDFQPGISILLRHDALKDNEEQYLGLELTGKLKDGKTTQWLVQTEIWQRDIDKAVGDNETTLGWYALLQYGFANGLTLGVRADYLEVTSSKDAIGNPIDDIDQALVPSIGFKASEFSHFRLAYNMKSQEDPNEGESKTETLELQTTLVLGAHPAHEF